jgi:hypothetical protein
MDFQLSRINVLGWRCRSGNICSGGSTMLPVVVYSSAYINLREFCSGDVRSRRVSEVAPNACNRMCVCARHVACS